MSAQAEVPRGEPLRDAWEAYKLTDDYANIKHWMLSSPAEHGEGSLWGAFTAGFNSQSSKLSTLQNAVRHYLDNVSTDDGVAYEDVIRLRKLLPEAPKP